MGSAGRVDVVDDRETGRTHRPAAFTQPFCSTPVLTPLLYHLVLPHPTLLPHCKPRNSSFLQSGPGARVTNARPGLALFCPFSFFHCFSQCPASSAVHVRFPRARGPLYTTRWGRSFGHWAKVWEVCGTQGQQHVGDGD